MSRLRILDCSQNCNYYSLISFLQDLIEMLLDLQRHHDSQAKRLGDLEDYLDQLLLRVMEATPGLLQNPFVSCKAQARYT